MKFLIVIFLLGISFLMYSKDNPYIISQQRLISIFLLGISSLMYSKDDPYIISQQRLISISPLYQSWDSGKMMDVSEFSAPFFAYLPFGRKLAVTIRGGGIFMERGSSSLNGMSDLQLGMNYHIEAYHMVFSMGVNLPSGKSQLEAKEFITASQISYDFYRFQAPTLGQGLNLNPGVIWAIPLSRGLILGLGASWLYKGKFKPLDKNTAKDPEPADFDPGDELLLTGGLDIVLTPTTTFTTDIIFTTYGEDKIDHKSKLKSGKRMIISTQLRKYFDLHELWVLARYQRKEKNTSLTETKTFLEDQKITPDQYEIRGQFRFHFQPRFSLRLLAEARLYDEIIVFPQKNRSSFSSLSSLAIIGIGVAPEISISSALKIPIRLKYTIGNLKYTGGESETDGNIFGIEAGIGAYFKF